MQRRRSSSDFLRLAPATHWGVGKDGGVASGVGAWGLGEGRLDPARRQRIDTNTLLRPRRSKAFCELHYASLARRVRRRMWRAQRAVKGTDVHDAPTARGKFRMASGAKPMHGGEVNFQHGRKIRSGEFRLAPNGARTVNKVMQFIDVGQQILHCIRIRYIQLHHTNVFVYGFTCFQPNGNYRCPFLCQGSSNGGADAAGAAGDEDLSVVEPSHGLEFTADFSRSTGKTNKCRLLD